MAFQFNSKSAFLTYPQCTITKEAMLYYLMEQFNPSFCRVGSELHEDGSPHLHVLMQADEPLRSKSSKFFDIHGFHPNIQSTRCFKRVLDYVGKTGNFIDFGELPSRGSKRSWADVVSGSSKEEALAMVMTDFPRDYVLNLERVEYFLNKHYATAHEPYQHDQTLVFNTPQTLINWADQRLEVSGAPQGSVSRRRAAYPRSRPCNTSAAVPGLNARLQRRTRRLITI
jgi:hypothetical protein